MLALSESKNIEGKVLTSDNESVVEDQNVPVEEFFEVLEI